MRAVLKKRFFVKLMLAIFGLLAITGAFLLVFKICWQFFSAPVNSFSTLPSSSVQPTLAGIFAVKEGNVFDDKTYANPFVSGLSFRIEWKEVQPTQNSFNWEKVDEIFEKAAASKKLVRLIVVPGFGAPGWALEGTKNDNFQKKYGKDSGVYERLPLPWDQTYLNRWFDFLGQLAQRYGKKPEFIAIAVAGPTSVSAEMSLPNEAKDIEKWVTLGYTPEKYINAWAKTFQIYAQIFPNQRLSLALYPGLPINNQGQFDRSQRVATRQKVIEQGLKYPLQFVLQTSGLNAGKDDDGAGHDIVLDYNGQIITGFQMSTSATRNPGKMGNVDDPVEALKLSADKGLKLNGAGQQIKFLEIYEPDILNPAMQGVLQDVSRRLAGKY